MAMSLGLAGLVVVFLGMQALPGAAQSVRPKPNPLASESVTEVDEGEAEIVAVAAASSAIEAVAPVAAPEPAPVVSAPVAGPQRGAVTNLPLPRYVSLKNGEGNARRGPGLTHRIDWVFTQAGMPLKITAEYENWRRVEDVDGLGGWVHYSLLSGTRSAIVRGDLVDFYSMARADSTIAFRAEAGVIARILTCENDWCRVQIEGERGWVPSAALWGVETGETIE